MVTAASAQSNYYYTNEALRYADNVTVGSARTLAMGNAFTALGGDLGAIAINPAGIGVFNHSEAAISFGLDMASSSSMYGGGQSSRNMGRFTIPNVGLVMSFDTGRRRGLVSNNIAFALNKVNDYNSKLNVNGVNNNTSWVASRGVNYGDYYENNAMYLNSANLAWNTTLLKYHYNGNYYTAAEVAQNPNLIPDGAQYDVIASTENMENGDIFVGGPLIQDYFKKTHGGQYEFAVNYAANISDWLYLGANLNLYSIDYVGFEQYMEDAQKTSDFQDAFDGFTYLNEQKTSGIGLNFKVGAMATLGGFRLGASVSTPTWYSMSEDWNESIAASFSNGSEQQYSNAYGSCDYQMVTPFRFSLGAAYVFGRVGLISFDYESANFYHSKLADNLGNNSEFSAENSFISRNIGFVDIYRLGGELNLGPTLLRAGYMHYNYGGFDKSVYYPDKKYISFGVGIPFGRAGEFDIAYQRQLPQKSYNLLYDDYIPEYSAQYYLKSNTSRIIATLTFKF